MTRLRNLLLSASLAVFVSSGQTPKPAQAQTAPENAKAEAYYNFAMGHLYAELAGAYGNRGDYLTKAIEHYKAALKKDPGAAFLAEELTDLYIQAGRLRDAILEAEDLLKQNPQNIEARRILGRIYTRMIGDPQQGKINTGMLRDATEQFQKIVEIEPKDLDAWLTLGRLYKAASNSLEAEKAYNKALALDPGSEDALTGLAIVYSDLGDTAKAIEKLKQLTDKNPNPRTLLALGSSYEQMRDYRTAAQVYRRALDLQPDNSRAKRALAQDLLVIGEFDEGLKLLGELAAEDPRDASVQLRIAEAWRGKRDFAKSRAALEKAKQIDGNSLEVRYDEVNLLDAEGKTDQAIALLKGIIEDTTRKSYSPSEKGNRAMLLERLGTLYRGANRPQEAVAMFRQIADLDPDGAPRVSVQIIETYRMARDYKLAQQEADAAMKRFPKERMVVTVHASLLAEQGKVDEAAAEMRALLSGDRDRDTWLALAQIYERGKRFADEAKALDEAEKLSTSRADKAGVAFMRGAMYEKMKDFDRAEAQFRKVLADDPDNASAMNYLGYMFADRGVKLDEAGKLITRALELDPDNGAYLDSLAWVYYKQNRLAEAETLLLRSLEKIGTDPTVHDHLGDVYLKQGKTRDAIIQWQASLKEWEASPPSEADPAEIAKVAKKLEDARVKLARETGSQK